MIERFPLLARALLSFGAAAALTAFSTPSSAQTAVWKMSSFIPSTHPYIFEVLVPWGNDVARVTSGRVKVEILPKVVGTPATQYEVVRDGMADVVTVIPGYSPGRFDVLGLGELPMASSDPKVGAVAYHDFYQKHLAPLKVFKGAHVLSAFTTSPGHVFTSKKPVTKASDFTGLKLRSPVATTVESLRAVNAVPMQKPSTEQYELITGGVLDGTLAGPDQVIGMRLAEMTRYLTLIPGGFYSSVLLVMVNEDVWSKLSEADRRAIDGVSGRVLASRVGEVFSKSVREGISEFKAKGGTVFEADAAMISELRKAFEPMEKSMFEKARKAGLSSPEAALAELKAKIAKGEAALK